MARPCTVVTGAAGALGSNLVRHLGARGHALVLVDRPGTEPALQPLAAAAPAGAVILTGDGTRAAFWEGVVPAARERLGAAPDGAVLAAGGWAGGSPVHEEEGDGAFLAMMAMNAETVYRALRGLLPAMVAAGRGSVVVLGSRNVERPWAGAGAAAYTASKAAAVALAQAAAAEVKDHGVRVNAVLPSTLDTPANRAAMPGADPGRWVSLPSATATIAFLLSDDARDVSGAALPLYGRA